MTSENVMTDREFNAFVRAAYDEAVKEGVVITRPWLTQQIVRKLDPPNGRDAALYACAAFRAIKAQVEKEVRTERRLEDIDKQQILPGYEWIQVRYSIIRNGEPCIVPTEEMTAAELRAKAKELRKLAIGALAHANELERLAEERESGAPGPEATA